MDDQNATVDEARRNAQHEAIKSHVQRDVNADIQHRSERATAGEADRAERVATDLRGRAIDDLAGKDREAFDKSVAAVRGLMDACKKIAPDLLDR